jgi:hypothetical protein
VRGWVLPSDLRGDAPVATRAARGARYYIEPFEPRSDPTLDDWLAVHGRTVVSRAEGRIVALER